MSLTAEENLRVAGVSDADAVDALPGARAAHGTHRGAAVGRGAADADARSRRRPRSQAAPRRRAVARPRAGCREAPAPDGAAGRERADRRASCWSSSTFARRSTSPTASYVMQRGRIVMSGTADEVHGRIDEIEATYLSGPRRIDDVTAHRVDERGDRDSRPQRSGSAAGRRGDGRAGIGAAVAVAVGRTGAYVVTVDPGVTVDGLGRDLAPAETTADRIVSAGGRRASIGRLGHRRGGHRRAVHGAGRRVRWARRGDQRRRYQPPLWLRRGRRGRLGVGAERAPRRIPQRVAVGATDHDGGRTRPDPGCHLGLRLATRQRGRVQLRRSGRSPRSRGSSGRSRGGVTVNTLSPIAATRMVTSGLRQQPSAASGGDQSQTGGLSLAIAAMPSPEEIGPVGAYLRERRVLVELREHHLLQRFRGGADRAAAALARSGADDGRRCVRPRPRHHHPDGVCAGRGRAGDERREQRPVRRRVRRGRADARAGGERCAFVPRRHR